MFTEVVVVFVVAIISFFSSRLGWCFSYRNWIALSRTVSYHTILSDESIHFF